MKYIIDNAHTWQAPFESVIRVKSFGNSSITFDHTIKRADTTAELAKILRTFVRVGSTGRPLKFSSAERDVLEQLKEKGAEETWEIWDQDDQEEPNHNHKTTMELTQFHTAMLTTHETNFSGPHRSRAPFANSANRAAVCGREIHASTFLPSLLSQPGQKRRPCGHFCG